MDDRDPRLIRRQERQRLIVELLADQALPTTELLRRLNAALAKRRQARVGRRTLELELRWMQRHLSGVLETVPASALDETPTGAMASARAFHRLRDGEMPHPIPPDAGCVTAMEALALSTARAALTVPAPPGSGGVLADALAGLMQRLGLPDDQTAIAVQAGGPQAPYASATLLACMRAIRGGSSLHGHYRPRHRGEHPVRIQPIRVLLVDGEAFVWAWDPEDRIAKRYHLARLRVERLGQRIAEAPADRGGDVAITMRQAFRGVARGALRSVCIRIVAERVPTLGLMVFNPDQRCEDRPDGSRTVAWKTRGLPALAEWIAGRGGAVVAEAPTDLVIAVARIANDTAGAHQTP